jgi:hypothetical protein
MIEEKEMAFLEELRKYENKWVAILENEDEEIIVGSGSDAVEAKSEAIARGFSDVVLFWVKPFGAGRIN